MPSPFDALVVGAGPGGSFAAWRLARGGARVALLDKARLPRYKTCGGALSPRALRMLPFPIESIEHSVVREGRIALNISEAVVGHNGRVLAVMTMREALDHALAQAAVQAGATLVDGCPVAGVDHEGDLMRVNTPHGPFQARFVVGADGATSVIGREAGLSMPQVNCPALEYELYTPEPTRYQSEAVAEMDLGFVPGGYAWIFPKTDHLSVGVGTTRRSSKGLKQLLHRYMDAHPALRRRTRCIEHGFVIPLYTGLRPIQRDRTLLVGDAAGLVDPFYGEGIYYAMKSGEIAADAVLGHLRQELPVRDYTARVRRELLPELDSARKVSRFVYMMPRVAYRLTMKNPIVRAAYLDVLDGRITYTDLWHLITRRPHRWLFRRRAA